MRQGKNTQFLPCSGPSFRLILLSNLNKCVCFRVKLKDGVAFLGARASNPVLWTVSQDVRSEGHRIVTLHCRKKDNGFSQRYAWLPFFCKINQCWNEIWSVHPAEQPKTKSTLVHFLGSCQWRAIAKTEDKRGHDSASDPLTPWLCHSHKCSVRTKCSQ